MISYATLFAKIIWTWNGKEDSHCHFLLKYFFLTRTSYGIYFHFSNILFYVTFLAMLTFSVLRGIQNDLVVRIHCLNFAYLFMDFFIFSATFNHHQHRKCPKIRTKFHHPDQQPTILRPISAFTTNFHRCDLAPSRGGTPCDAVGFQFISSDKKADASLPTGQCFVAIRVITFSVV